MSCAGRRFEYDHQLQGNQGFRESARRPFRVIAAVRHHHEDYDGGGYPDGLASPGQVTPCSFCS
ncbi:MAG TPA: hypothetical protein DCL13_05220 [Peptococcaceae bacterium]|nr:hypothetical protein [Peptococcaceae bacterium]